MLVHDPLETGEIPEQLEWLQWLDGTEPQPGKKRKFPTHLLDTLEDDSHRWYDSLSHEEIISRFEHLWDI